MQVLDAQEMRKFIYDPNKIQTLMLDYIREANKGQLDIVDPTNPFTMLLEATAVNGSNPILEMKTLMRRMYSNLANTKQDLYPHLYDSVLINMFSVPSEANIVFYINIMELKQNGYRPTGAKYIETVIPEYTEVTVADTTFTLLNDIIVRLYDEGSVFVEQQTSKSPIAINSLGILPGVVVSDAESNSWILFETTVKQIKRNVVSDTIIVSEGFNKTVKITDQYYYSDVAYKNSNTNGKYVSLAKTHDDAYIDPYTPTVFISQGTDSINFKIPDVYVVDGGISGNTNITIYQTKGRLFLPINSYKTDDFSLVLGNIGKTLSSATSPNITILANSRYIVDGGRDELTVDEIKQAIITNTTGANELPITNDSIKRLGSFNDFEMFKAIDILTSRTYIASRNTSTIDTSLINSRADIFTNRVQIVLSDYLNNDNVYIKNDIFVIKSGTLFVDKNGIVSIVDQDELNNIKLLSKVEMLNYFKVHKYFITPYYYVIDKQETIVNTRVYDLDTPELNNLILLGKNVNIIPRVNIDKYLIEKTSTGYKITMSLIGNKDFDKLDPTKVRAQLKIDLYDSTEAVYYESTYDVNTKYISFDITTDDYIDSNDNMVVTNGTTTLSSVIISLMTNLTITIYTLDTTIIDPSHYLANELYITKGDYITVFSKEKLAVIFGTNLKYIWNKVSAKYNERKYLKYTQNIPLVYNKIVYNTDATTGTIFGVNNVKPVIDAAITVVASAAYSIIIDSVIYSYTSTSNATLTTIQNGLIAAITSTIVTVAKNSTGLILTGVTAGLDVSITATSNISITITTPASSDLAYSILHNIGDPVLDASGAPVYEHKIGDVVMDTNGLPKVDTTNGVIRYIDILMLEYEYKLADTNVYINYYKMLLDTLRLWLTTQLGTLNEAMLENTSALFKSYKSVLPIKVDVSGTVISLPYLVRPIVTIYVRTNTYTQEEVNAIKNKIGHIIHHTLDGITVSLEVIKKTIMAEIDTNIVGVKIVGIDNVGGLEVFNLNDKTVRLVIDKIMNLNLNNELTVEYDLSLNIQQI